MGVVVHCTAGVEDLSMSGTDSSAENTARYAGTTTRQVSWHAGNDSDSIIELLPPHYVAWHTIGYHDATYGHEISKRHMTWTGMPAAWVTATLTLAAQHMGKIARDAGIPFRHISKEQLDKAIAAGDPSMGGFVGHRQLDPTRRTDPGTDFPWERFLTMARGETTTNPIEEEDVTPEQFQSMLFNALNNGMVGRDENRRSILTMLAETARNAEIARALAERAAKGDTLTDAQMAAVIDTVARKYAG